MSTSKILKIQNILICFCKKNHIHNISLYLQWRDVKKNNRRDQNDQRFKMEMSRTVN